MTTRPRDHQGRFTRTQDAARIADKHIEPISPSAETIARLYCWPEDPIPQAEIDAADRGLPWVTVIVLGCAAMTCLGLAVALVGML